MHNIHVNLPNYYSVKTKKRANYLNNEIMKVNLNVFKEKKNT